MSIIKKAFSYMHKMESRKLSGANLNKVGQFLQLVYQQ